MRRLFAIAACLCLVLPALARQDAPRAIRFARHPALSPDGKMLAFSYKGDIWTVPAEGGTAARFTIHEAHDQLPAWSPDGKWIAFSSRRQGNYDIFVAPAGGGAPRQVTRHTSDDSVGCWTPDGREILFTSAREGTRTSALYAVDVQTCRSRLIRADDSALANPAMSPDGQWIACTRGGSWTRKGYRGSGSSDLLLIPAAGGAGKLLTHTLTNERWPLFTPDGKGIYYVSDASGTPNVVYRPLSGGGEKALTKHTEPNLHYPTLSRDGKRLAYELEFGIRLMDTATRDSRDVKIFAPSDERENPTSRMNYGSGLQEAQASADGKQVAFVIHGEVFTMPASGGDAVRITETPQREEDTCWTPDGKALIFSSDRDGNQELYRADLKTREAKRITTTADTAESGPRCSPDGKWVAYLRGGNSQELCILSPDGGTPRVLVTDPSIGGIDWSPDSKWIAYHRMRSHSAGTVADIFVVNVGDPKPINITRYPCVNTSPAWSRDAKLIFYVSNRTEKNQVYSVALTDPKAADDDDDAKPAGGKAEADKPAAPPATVIDVEGIEDRGKQVTSSETGVGGFALSPDGKSVVFTMSQMGKSDFWRVAATGGAMTRLTQAGEAGGGMQFLGDTPTLLFQAGGSMRTLNVAAATPAVAPLAFQAPMELDRKAELCQMFDEAWRKMRDGFYDATMHGCDWNAVRARYRPIVEDLEMKEDFYTLFTLALGELNASHTGISGAAPAGGSTTASLGVLYDDSFAGPGMKVARVITKGPADRPNSLVAGDVVTAVQGKPFTSNEEFHRLMADLAGKKVEVTVKPAAGAEKTVKIKPVAWSAIRPLEYDRWVKERRAQVAKLGNGRLSYVHLDGMGVAQLERFKRLALGEGQEKEGLVLDLRFNGGGSIADEMFAILNNRVFGWRTLRGDPNKLPAPMPCFTRPVVVLINEQAFSNAEVFPWGFKGLKMGKIVGVATYGGVIGTGGTTLIDGTSLRMPAVGSFTMDGKDMESNGCPPDIEVEQTPEDIVAGRDRQLERAIEEILKQIGKPAG